MKPGQTQLNAIEAADWPPVIHGERQLLEAAHENWHRALDLREYSLGCLRGYMATTRLPFSCPFLDHHLVALTKRD